MPSLPLASPLARVPLLVFALATAVLATSGIARSAAVPITLTNDVGTTASIDGAGGLQALAAAGGFSTPLTLRGDAWAIELVLEDMEPPEAVALSPTAGGCNFTGVTATAMDVDDGGGDDANNGAAVAADRASASWDCAVAAAPAPGQLPLVLTVTAQYDLRPGATFVAKTLSVHSSRAWSPVGGGVFTVTAVSPWGAALEVSPNPTHPPPPPNATVGTAGGSILVPTNPFNPGLSLGLFARWPGGGGGSSGGGRSNTGFFLATTNPWATFTGGRGGGACANNTDMRNSDIVEVQDLSSAAQCYAKCEAVPGAVGWVWDACDADCWCKGARGAVSAATCRCYGLIGNDTITGPANDAFVVSSTYAQNLTHYPSTTFGEDFTADIGIVGLTALTKYSTPDGINSGEMAAFRVCVKSFLLDGAARSNGTVKVNVAWDESDYQIDAGTAAGVTEYKRIIDRNAQLGVTHVVYEPRNTLHADRHNSTDGWGWEAGLWFSMGERLREGNWAPQDDPVPADIKDMVAYAAGKGVRLLAYVYPCLAFQAQAQAVVNGALDLSSQGVAEWMHDTLAAFMRGTGAGGFAWDHDIFAGDQSMRYAQWRAWASILNALRAEFPDMVMDHRQTAHMWGPWYQLAGSYSEPLAGDENPETFGVDIPSLHTDHVAADHLRRINWVYAVQQLQPVERVPGFMFHQTERTADNGDAPCFGNSQVCYDNNTRDADLLGYRYSVISNLATAPLNNVLCMIPARDPAEFELFPAEDVAFIQRWLQFGDRYRDGVLDRVAPILTLPQPGTPGAVDGTAAFSADGAQGFVFLFNPSMSTLNASLIVDESIHLPNASSSSSWPSDRSSHNNNNGDGDDDGDAWTVQELYPRNYTVGEWVRNHAVDVAVAAGSARVLSLSKHAAAAPAQAPAPPQLTAAGMPGIATAGATATAAGPAAVVAWEGAEGAPGSTIVGVVAGPESLLAAAAATGPPVGGVLVNGVVCSSNNNNTTSSSGSSSSSSNNNNNNNAANTYPDVSSRGASARAHYPRRGSTAAQGGRRQQQQQQQQLRVAVDFAGDGDAAVRKLMPLGAPPAADNTGGAFAINFSVPLAVKHQLAARAQAYPIAWQPAEYNATWLVPTRLIATIYATAPSDAWVVTATVDGKPAPVSRSYNSRGLVRSKVFLGWYLDLAAFFGADADFGAPHALQLTLPTGLSPGQFQGVFLENVETEYTASVRACRVL